MKAIIMAGGQGLRFWPLSRIERPKQFLRILGSKTMLQETANRLQPMLTWDDIYVVCGKQYVKEVSVQLPELKQGHIIVESAARGTAACIGLAAIYLRRVVKDDVMLILPCDHAIQDLNEFQRVLRVSEELARGGWLVTFGIEPTGPVTGYGYLLRGQFIDEPYGQPAYRVDRFTEKPSLNQAQEFLEKGDHYWNSGMFVWTVNRILEEINLWMPELGEVLVEFDQDKGNSHEKERIFSSLENISVDSGIMEKSTQIAMLPCNFGWNDLGSWNTLSDIFSADSKGVVSNVPYANIDSRNCVVYGSRDKMVSLLGVENLIVVETPDVLFICSRNRSKEVDKVLSFLRENELGEYL